MATDLTRRDLLKGAAATTGALALTGCEGVISLLTEDVPTSFGVARGAAVDPAFHLLSRAAWGPRPGDIDEVQQLGREAWIERQLDPASIDDWRCELRARRFEAMHVRAGTAYEFKKRQLRKEIIRHTVLRATYSERQLFEVMVRFWTDHINIDLTKGDCIYLKPADDREVIRKHALGRFRDLIRASATSPAMLIYLDGASNVVRKPGDVPNENYARELCELHTMGVDGGYTQDDVLEIARCLSGWTVKQKGFRRGRVFFRKGAHDDGQKRVLGHVIPAGGGESDLDRVVEIVCAHPSTARYICTKLVRRFVADPPPPGLVAKAARTFTATDGDIAAVLRTILLSDQFDQAPATLLKRPFRFVVSALRATAADSHARREIMGALEQMGQEPFAYPTPDGYPSESGPWLGTLLWRWNFALALAGGTLGKTEVPGQELAKGLGYGKPKEVPSELLFAHLVGRLPDAAERTALDDLRAQSPDDLGPLAGLVMASPAFQLH